MIKDLRAHTTLPAVDMERATKFYAEKLGLTPATEMSTGGGVFYEVGGGTRFLLFPSANPARGGHTQIGFTTPDIKKEVAALRARGVVFEEYDLPGFKTVDSIAQVGPNQAAWFKDSEGNMIGVVQLPPGAEPGT
jgi:catechol 2,3-dioxygenase-like lactoylglutathione lyase family enzyme